MKNSIIIITILAVITAVLTSCGGSTPRHPSTAANVEAALRTPPVQLYDSPAPKTEGSLYSDDLQPNLFSDLRAANIGDIVTINIVETSKASKNSQTQLDRKNEVDATISALLGFENYNHPIINDIAPGFNLGTGIDAKYESKFKGTGKTSRNETMTAQISARVIQKLPNGNLVIRGSREITVNYEKQYITIQGVVRPQDISPDNTILSTYIADAKIDYTGKGDVTNQQRKGWLSRLLDYIWPF